MANPILQLRGSFSQKRRPNGRGSVSLPANTEISSSRVRELRDTLEGVRSYWEETPHEYKPLIAVRYNRIIAKSRRIQRLLSETSSKSSNDTIVGARFHDNGGSLQHVITHCVSHQALNSSVEELGLLADCIDELCGGVLTTEALEAINNKKADFSKLPLSKSVFAQLASDVCCIERFALNNPEDSIPDMAMVTLFKNTGIDNIEFLRRIGVAELNLHSCDGSTFLLTPNQYRLLYAEAPQLIAMAIRDINEIPQDNSEDGKDNNEKIPAPGNEPWIGVFDTPFNDEVYFADWVESTVEIDKSQLEREDFIHGTCVTSIIVDGPTLNPMLDDGCGRFRVRHVGIASGRRFSSSTVVREIEKAVIKYPEVKVWNISLGSLLEIPENYVSAEASVLDRIQTEHDVIFVVAGTNDCSHSGVQKIGSPADSVNSLVVNAIKLNGEPCSYSRKGPVLSFFGKPDVSYYGGDSGEPLRACCEPRVDKLVAGTSFAAPWISRKMAYLIHVAGLSREVAKALIIDSACGWASDGDPNYVGYGVVPKRIEDILSTSDNEIKFLLAGTSELYDTYTHNIPVPMHQNMHPYHVKATLCYFPHCERSQGVDYTSTEITLTLGRINGDGIKPIDNNMQDVSGYFTYEEEARHFFRKWDNVKHIAEKINPRGRAKKSYGIGLWGVSLKTKERLNEAHGENIRFGLVVTLRAMDGVNRIDDFIQRCSFRAWLVNKIDIVNQVEIFNAAEQEIEFE